MTPSVQHLVLLALLWLCYFSIHSLLASLKAKRWVANRYPGLMPWYRVIFNIVAIVLIGIPLTVSLRLSSTPLWEWNGVGFFVANGLAVLAMAGFIWSLRFYDGSEFTGLRQLRAGQRSVEDQEHFFISPLHRFVRHPWYALILVILWTRDMDSASLVTAIAITVYFIVGSRLEEQKLLVYHGEVYRNYRTRVSGLVPFPGRYLTRQQFDQMMQQNSKFQPTRE